MIYAPIVIQTLERFEHLTKCIESLEKCTGSSMTDVYVALDYPPSQKYIEGWKENDSYLHKKELKHNFHSFNVVRREENYYFNGKGNGGSLLLEVFKQFDRAIFSEDDNVFAPNFLEFINKGLEKFKNDPTIYSICGYGFFYNLKYQDNNYIRQNTDYNAWGCGLWREKYLKLYEYDYKYLKRIVYNPFKTIKIWNVSNVRLNDLLYLSQKKNFKRADNFLTLYLINENMYQIMPRISKVRNIGWDGSGTHCVGFEASIEYKHLNQFIDENNSFDYYGDGWECFDENRKIIVKEDFRQVGTLKVLIKYFLRVFQFWK